MTTNMFSRRSVNDLLPAENISPLIKAAADGNLEELERVLNQSGDQIELSGGRSTGIDVNGRYGIFPKTALHSAVISKEPSVVRRLLQVQGINVNIENYAHYTPLLLAAENGSLDIFKMLFNFSGTNKEAVNNYRQDALMCACKRGNLNIVEYLLPLIPDIWKTDNSGYTALMLAASEGHLDVVECLTKLSRRKNKKFQLNARTKDNGRTLLMLAALHPQNALELVTYILDTNWPCQNINLDVMDDAGSTALMLAAAEGFQDIVVKLCEKGADVNLTNNIRGRTALMLAASQGHQETVRVLLNLGNINIMATDHLGQTALILAAKDNRLHCVKAILEEHKSNSVFVNAITFDGTKTALTATNESDIRLELIKAYGCDVRGILDTQVEIRRNIRRAIIMAGKADDSVWANILSKDESFVLPILVLMAEEIEDIDKDEGFWMFFMQNAMGKKYILGTKKDEENNTIYHYLAKSKNVQVLSGRILKLLLSAIDSENIEETDLATVLLLKNKQGNTILHTAAFYDNFERVYDTVKQCLEKRVDQSIKNIFTKENNDKLTCIAAALKCNTDELYLKTLLETIQKMPKATNTKEIYQVKDVRRNTLLHLAAKKNKFVMISYLADKPVGVRDLNDSGFNPLHIAVLKSDYDLFCHIFKELKHRFEDIINEPTAENETVLHLAAKKGNEKLLAKIVKLGGDLARQDDDGHTPLHDCLQQAHLEGGATYRERCNIFKTVWSKTVEVSAIWWCNYLNIPLPDPDSQIYQDFKRDAIYYLRSSIINNRGFSVLQYAGHLGLSACVEAMITEERIFVRKQCYASTVSCSTDSRWKFCVAEEKVDTNVLGSSKYEIEITDLMPEFMSNVTYKYDGYDRIEEKVAEKQKEHRYRRKTTFVESLAKVKPPLKASELLQIVPMLRLTKWQWHVYQMFSLFWLVIHCVFMTFCTVNSQTDLEVYPSTRNVSSSVFSNQSSVQESLTSHPGLENTVLDLLVLVYALLICCLMTILPTFKLYKSIRKSQTKKKRSKIPEEYTYYKTYHQYVEDKGALLSFFTYSVAYIVEQLTAILPFCFAVFAVVLYCSVEFTEITSSQYAWMKGNFLLFGWLLILIPLRAYSPIYNFLCILKFIIIKDLIPFVLFFVMITVAFSCAIQLQFQLLSENTIGSADNASGFYGFISRTGNVLYELVIMTASMETDLNHIQSVADLFHVEKQKSLFLEALLVGYALISVVIMLNMLIAMMGTTLSMVVREHGTGWRQYQVIQALRIRNFLIDIRNCCTTDKSCSTCNRNNPPTSHLTAQYRQSTYSLVPQHTVVSGNNILPSKCRMNCCVDHFVRRPKKTRQDDRTKRWYLVLTRLELKEIRAKYWQQTSEGVVNKLGEIDEIPEDTQLHEVKEKEINRMMALLTEQSENKSYDIVDKKSADAEDNGSRVQGPNENYRSTLEERITAIEKQLVSLEKTVATKFTSIEHTLTKLTEKLDQ